jgi:GTPase SAR1 family protein
VAVVVVDLTHRPTLLSLDKWVEDIRDIRGDDAVIFIAANKADLDEGREISGEEVRQKAADLCVGCFETSALTGNNVRRLFVEAAKQIPQAKTLPECSKLGETIHVTPQGKTNFG